MSSNSSGKRLEGFFTGKGFYIVLFLCAAVIGVSAWMMAAGNETMEDLNKTNDISLENKRVETIIVPPQTSKEPEASDTAGTETQPRPISGPSRANWSESTRWTPWPTT